MKNKGFTLIELLVAISIVAILSVVGITSYQGVNARARDSVRKNDLNNIAIALEIYYQSNGSYVADSVYINEAFKKNVSNETVPTDPATGENYYYVAENNEQSFRLFAKLEKCNPTDPDTLCDQSWNYSIYSADLTLAAAP